MAPPRFVGASPRLQRPPPLLLPCLPSGARRSSTRVFGTDQSPGENATAAVDAPGVPIQLVSTLSPEDDDGSHLDAASSRTITPTITTTTPLASHPVSAWLQENVFMGIQLTPEIMAIVTVYFVQGALGLARLAKTYLLKDELHLGPAELSALTGAFALPWTIKPLYGFLTDGFPLFGYRRKTYLVAAGLLGSLSYGLLSWTPFWDALPDGTAIPGTLAAILVGSASVAMSDVVTDGIVVTRTRQATDPAVAGGLQSLCWGASATGSIISAYYSGSLLEELPVRAVFGLTAFLPLLVALIAFQVDEEPVVAAEEAARSGFVQNVKEQTASLWEAFRQDSIWKPALFIFLWQSTPTADGAFFFFMSNDLGLGPEFMGRVRLVSSVATLAGVVVYNQYLKRVAIKDILFWATLASLPLGLVPVLLVTHVNQALGIPDQALIYGDDVALAALGEIAFLPTLVLAARLCPPGAEAVLFATLMSIFNGASTVGTELGAALTKVFGITESNFDNLAVLLVVCNITSLYPLLFIQWLDKVGDESVLDVEVAEAAAAPKIEKESQS
jgi:folate/biopterin transporter